MGLGDLAELLGEGLLLVGRQLLVPEEDDVIPIERVAHRRHHALAQRPGDVDAMDLGADDRAQ